MTELGAKWVKEQSVNLAQPLNVNLRDAHFWLRAFCAAIEERVEAVIAAQIKPDWDREDVELASGTHIRLRTFYEVKRELLGE